MSFADILGNICGFLTVIGGIFLLNAFRDMKVSWRDISSARKIAPPSEERSTLLNDSDADHDLRETGMSNGLINRP